MSKKKKSLNNKEVEKVKEQAEATAPVNPEPTPEPVKKGKYIAAKDINPKIRKGDVIPEEMVDKWKLCGIDYKGFIE